MWSGPEEEQGNAACCSANGRCSGSRSIAASRQGRYHHHIEVAEGGCPHQRHDVPRRSGIGCDQQQLPRLPLGHHVLNQPSLSRQAWQEVVDKMITAYKAPVSPDDAKAIVDYLVHTKGKGAS